jgi:hypothetical protein
MIKQYACFKIRKISEKALYKVELSLFFGPLAQSVEQRTFNPWVVGSIPTGPTKLPPIANKEMDFQI